MAPEWFPAVCRPARPRAGSAGRDVETIVVVDSETVTSARGQPDELTLIRQRAIRLHVEGRDRAGGTAERAVRHVQRLLVAAEHDTVRVEPFAVARDDALRAR